MVTRTYKQFAIYHRGKNMYEVRGGYFGDRHFTSIQKAKDFINTIV